MSASAHDRSPPSPASSSGSSAESSGAPSTPPLSTSLPIATTFMNFTSDDALNGVAGLSGAKRSAKNTRRVNTAERRATHNAVERARRETLNGRFLVRLSSIPDSAARILIGLPQDLAALLPNLNTIRRPSKSAIVNSSIAHLNASRRHRVLTAQTLRMIKDETDALRHEVNQWRTRAGIQTIEEPMRGDAFGLLLSGELEIEQADLLEGSEEGDEEEGVGCVYPVTEHSPAEYAMHHQQLAQMQHPHHGAYPPEQGYYSGHSPSYENPAAGYYESGVPAVHPEQQWAYDKQRRASLPANVTYPHPIAPSPVRPTW